MARQIETQAPPNLRIVETQAGHHLVYVVTSGSTSEIWSLAGTITSEQADNLEEAARLLLD